VIGGNSFRRTPATYLPCNLLEPACFIGFLQETVKTAVYQVLRSPMTDGVLSHFEFDGQVKRLKGCDIHGRSRRVTKCADLSVYLSVLCKDPLGAFYFCGVVIGSSYSNRPKPVIPAKKKFELWGLYLLLFHPRYIYPILNLSYYFP